MILSAALVSLRSVGCLREERRFQAGTCALGVGRSVAYVKTLAALLDEPASVSFSKGNLTRWGNTCSGAFSKECDNV